MGVLCTIYLVGLVQCGANMNTGHGAGVGDGRGGGGRVLWISLERLMFKLLGVSYTLPLTLPQLLIDTMSNIPYQL